MANSNTAAAVIALTPWTSQSSVIANTGMAASKMHRKRKAIGKIENFAL
jgi:hypothetical protein